MKPELNCTSRTYLAPQFIAGPFLNDLAIESSSGTTVGKAKPSNPHPLWFLDCKTLIKFMRHRHPGSLAPKQGGCQLTTGLWLLTSPPLCDSRTGGASRPDGLEAR